MNIIHEALEHILRNTYFNSVFSSVRGMISVCYFQEQMGKSQRLVCASSFPAIVSFTHQHFLGKIVTFGTSLCVFGDVPVFLYLSLRGQGQCQAVQVVWSKYQAAHCERASLAARKFCFSPNEKCPSRMIPSKTCTAFVCLCPYLILG